MVARNPAEQGRGSSPLELLFDLTFVIAVGVAAENLADLVSAGHGGHAVLGFVFAMFAILAGWINFAWFASAFDTDDWGYRLATMVQMVGVIVLAIGLPATFHSIDIGHRVDVRVLVAGYVVMRIGMVSLWLRVARQSTRYRVVARRNALAILVIQAAWVIFALFPVPLWPTFVVIAVLGAGELLIPVFAQGRASGTPWHAEHIADRYSAFAIIALGEAVVGTVASSRGALGGSSGLDWDASAVTVAVAGTGLTFAMWWIYFVNPFAELLRYRPGRGYVFGYGHIAVLMAIAATGAGLRAAGGYLQGHSHLGAVGAVVGVVVPVGVYLLAVFALYTLLLARLDVLHLWLLTVAGVFLAAALSGAAAGLAVPGALLFVTAAVVAVVVGYEWIGHEHQARMLGELTG